MLLPNQNSLLVKRQNDNTSPGNWPRKISPLVIYWMKTNVNIITHSDLTWDFGKPPFLLHFGKIFKKKKIPKIHKIGKIKTLFGLGMTPV